jgi:hypothetical protein
LLGCVVYRKAWPRLPVLVGLAVILVAPVCVVNTITSGYPLFPSLPLRLPVSWALSLATDAAVKESIEKFPFVYHSYDGLPKTVAQKLAHLFWVDNAALFPLAGLNLLGAAVLAKESTRSRSFQLSIVAGGLLMIFGIALAFEVPARRFVAGYLAVVPILALAHLGTRWMTGAFAACWLIWLVEPWQNLSRLDIARLFVFGAAVFISLPRHKTRLLSGLLILGLFGFQYMRPLMSAVKMARGSIVAPHNLLIPPAPPSLEAGEFTWVPYGDVLVRTPVGAADRCWATEPPCAAVGANFGTVKGLRYREPGSLASGFEESQPN